MTLVIHPSDFRLYGSTNATWQGAEMACVVRALNGRDVAITIDTASGSTLIGASLHGVKRHRGKTCVGVQTYGRSQPQWFPLGKCGMVLPLSDRTNGQTLRKAVGLFQAERTAAVEAARVYVESEAGGGRNHGEYQALAQDGDGLWWAWYTPTGDAPAGRNPGSGIGLAIQVKDGKAAVSKVVYDHTGLDRLLAGGA
ncbi:hypothetical protein [Streptomyces yaizuensis]|uniref:Uncharacterized protein n=1 Tax=Streptomyces yaizuensis TaxID=2989713 RepID=A0AA86J317_9ACTN|nr:hypothetical protein [Streptomyces sp. YSPA8]BDT39512.1 hypothetical protein SYYSPA8_36970 [Streptomyces sp. YSPA8]